MSVYPADSPTHEAVALNKRHHFIVAARGNTWQTKKQRQYFRAAMQRAARQFANDEWVAFHFFAAEQGTERSVAPPEMVLVAYAAILQRRLGFRSTRGGWNSVRGPASW